MKTWLSRYFIPSHHNDFAPHILQKAAVVLMGGLIALTFTLSTVSTLLWQASDWLVATVLPAVIIDLTNEERDNLGEHSLVRNAVLDEAARLKAEHMAEYGYFAHYAPDGTSPWHWFSLVGYQYAHAGENLAIHFSESDEVVKAWMNSPTHKDNIVDEKFTEIGVGTARGSYNGFETVYVVQLFGTPRMIAAEPAVVAIAPEPEPEPAPMPEVLPASVDAEQEIVAGEVPVSEAAPGPESGSEPLPASIEEESEETEQSETLALAELESGPEPVAPEPFTTEIAEEPAPERAPSDTITTSTAAVPATIGTGEPPQQQSRFFERVLTAPSGMLEIVYIMLSVLVVASLMLSIVIEWRRQHPVQIAYGLMLLFLMGGLYYAHISLTSGAMIV